MQLSLFFLLNCSQQKSEARANLKMFDNFLCQLTQNMNNFAARLVNPAEAQSKYAELDLDYHEKFFINLLMLQVQNNVSTVRTFSDTFSKHKQ
jgi:hypothetical protein